MYHYAANKNKKTKQKTTPALELSSPGFSTLETPPPSLPLPRIWCLSFPRRPINLTTHTQVDVCQQAMHGISDILKIFHKWFSATFCLFDLQFLRSTQIGTRICRTFIHLSLLCVTPLHEYSTSGGPLSCWWTLSHFHLLGNYRQCSAEDSCKHRLLLTGKRAFQVYHKEGTCSAMGSACLQLSHTWSNWSPRGQSQPILL